MALLVVGIAASLVQQYWPILVLAGVVALVVYAVRRWPSSTASPPVAEESPLRVSTTTERTGAGEITIRFSIGDGAVEDRRSVDPDSVWVPPGRTVTVAGFTLRDGMVYVGQNLRGLREWSGAEPALIDPALSVDTTQPDRLGEGLSYWPSYSSISPASRAAYLEWLASGRSNPSTPLGYVFLFFYGLERRLLSDARTSAAARAEEGQIVAEVGRLLKIYGENGSFSGYAGSFLDSIHAARATGRMYAMPPPRERAGYDLPATLRMALGQLVADGKPIPADWAWAWLICHPETHLRTPAQRCSAEFQSLFKLRYTDTFKEGMRLKPNATKVGIVYRPASASFGGPIDLTQSEVPDVTALERPLRQLRDLAYKCNDDLDPYSRLLGRNPEAKGTLEASSLLPPELTSEFGGKHFEQFKQWVVGRLPTGRDSVAVPGRDLLNAWRAPSADKLSKADAVSVAQMLERLGFGVEPDVRFGGPPFAADSSALFFRLTHDAPSAPSPAYSAGTLVLHLGATVAAADGSVSDLEQSHLERHLESLLDLSSGEQERMRAHLAWLTQEHPGMERMKKRIDGLSDAQRRTVGRLVVAVAGSDGHVSPTEIKILTKVYKLLGFNPETAYRAVHAASASTIPPALDPVTVVEREPSSSGFAIPPPPERTPGAVDLDPARIAKTVADTAAVTAILSTVFVEDASEARAPSAEGDGQHSINGLDSLHSAFLRALSERTSWPRSDIEQLTARLGLFPDGAIERVNEVAFEKCGEPLCDGDNPIVISANVMKELLQ